MVIWELGGGKVILMVICGIFILLVCRLLIIAGFDMHGVMWIQLRFDLSRYILLTAKPLSVCCYTRILYPYFFTSFFFHIFFVFSCRLDTLDDKHWSNIEYTFVLLSFLLYIFCLNFFFSLSLFLSLKIIYFSSEKIII